MADQKFADSTQSATEPTGRYKFFKRVSVTSTTPVTIATFTMDPDTVAMVRYRAIGRDVALSVKVSQAAIRIYERVGGGAPVTVTTNDLITEVDTAGELSFTTDGSGTVTAIFTGGAGAFPGTVSVAIEIDVIVT